MTWILEWTSIILFIIESINAKKENRKRKTWIKVVFGIGIGVMALELLITGLIIGYYFFGFLFCW